MKNKLAQMQCWTSELLQLPTGITQLIDKPSSSTTKTLLISVFQEGPEQKWILELNLASG
jgi:hypothetical protein